MVENGVLLLLEKNDRVIVSPSGRNIMVYKQLYNLHT